MSLKAIYLSKQLPMWLKKHRFFLMGIALPLLLLTSIGVRLKLAYDQTPYPQMILTLGGGPIRPRFTAHFAQAYPSLEIWVSSGLPPAQIQAIFASADLSRSRVYLNYEAVDTVTNFTTLVDNLERRQIHHLYLITSDFHMRRAVAIAILVLGSQGIAFTPVAIPTERSSEPLPFVILDILRAVLWLLTGYTGAELNAYFSYDQIRRVFSLP
jgi:uncharacterized SAM-binding protein YcdF (DUF218 family)